MPVEGNLVKLVYDTHALEEAADTCLQLQQLLLCKLFGLSPQYTDANVRYYNARTSMRTFLVCAHLGDLGGGLVLGFLDECCFALLC